MKRGDWEAAEKLLRTKATAARDNTVSWYGLGALMARQGKGREFVQEVTALVESVPSSVARSDAPADMLARILLVDSESTGDSDELLAISDRIEGSREGDQDDALSPLTRALWHYRQGEYGSAIRGLLQSHPGAVPGEREAAEVALAMVFHRVGLSEEANETLAKAQDCPRAPLGDQ